MEPQVAILVVSFVVLLLLNVPIAASLGLAALLTVVSLGDVPASFTVAQQMSTGIAKFSLLAIPFFVLAGILMGEGGMARPAGGFCVRAGRRISRRSLLRQHVNLHDVRGHLRFCDGGGLFGGRNDDSRDGAEGL